MNIQDVITPADRRTFLKKVGFGVGATMLGSVALPAILTKPLHATERCTTSCSGQQATLITAIDATNSTYVHNHNVTHASVINKLWTNVATATDVAGAESAANVLFNNMLSVGLVAQINNYVASHSYSPLTTTELNNVYSGVQSVGMNLPYSDLATICNPLPSVGQSIWNAIHTNGAWATLQSGLSTENNIAQKLAGKTIPINCTDLDHAQDMFNGIGVVFGIATLAGGWPAVAVSVTGFGVAFGIHLFAKYNMKCQ